MSNLPKSRATVPMSPVATPRPRPAFIKTSRGGFSISEVLAYDLVDENQLIIRFRYCSGMIITGPEARTVKAGLDAWAVTTNKPTRAPASWKNR